MPLNEKATMSHAYLQSTPGKLPEINNDVDVVLVVCLPMPNLKKASRLSDPYHRARSGPTSGNVDPDPGSKKFEKSFPKF